jgi:hypothetical protein
MWQNETDVAYGIRSIMAKRELRGQWVPPHGVTACVVSILQHHLLFRALLLHEDMTVLISRYSTNSRYSLVYKKVQSASPCLLTMHIRTHYKTARQSTIDKTRDSDPVSAMPLPKNIIPWPPTVLACRLLSYSTLLCLKSSSLLHSKRQTHLE